MDCAAQRRSSLLQKPRSSGTATTTSGSTEMAMKVVYTVVNGRVLSENRNGVKRDYVSDSLGSTVALIDNTQTITDRFTYWPYGERRTHTGTNVTALQYVGTQ